MVNLNICFIYKYGLCINYETMFEKFNFFALTIMYVWNAEPLAFIKLL